MSRARDWSGCESRPVVSPSSRTAPWAVGQLPACGLCSCPLLGAQFVPLLRLWRNWNNFHFILAELEQLSFHFRPSSYTTEQGTDSNYLISSIASPCVVWLQVRISARSRSLSPARACANRVALRCVAAGRALSRFLVLWERVHFLRCGLEHPGRLCSHLLGSRRNLT